MNASQAKRIARQLIQADQLMGVDSVPMAPPGIQGKKASSQEGKKPDAQTLDLGHGTLDKGKKASSQEGKKPEMQTLDLGHGALDSSHRTSGVLDMPSRLRLLESMDRDEVRVCAKCELCRGRTQTVFGEGDAGAALMFVGEGPGETEDRMGRPFVGRAGELLDKQIVAMGLKREQVYIANVVKCRPPNNRTPTPAEAKTCSEYLFRQIAVIRPRVIVTLGGPATKLLLDTQTGITVLRGQWASFGQLEPEVPAIPVMPTFHPAYLLRAYTVDNRKKVWSDLQQVMDKLKAD